MLTLEKIQELKETLKDTYNLFGDYTFSTYNPPCEMQVFEYLGKNISNAARGYYDQGEPTKQQRKDNDLLLEIMLTDMMLISDTFSGVDEDFKHHLPGKYIEKMSKINNERVKTLLNL